jgi:hypothetical protein
MRGEELKRKSWKMKKADKPITIKGLVIPVDWDEKGRVIAAAISTCDEDEYLIEKIYKGEELLGLLRREVEVRCVVRERENKKKVRVQEYSISKDEGSADDQRVQGEGTGKD